MTKNVDTSYIKTDKSIVVNYNGETFTALAGTPEYDMVAKCIATNSIDDIPNAISKALAINSYSDGNFTVKEGRLCVNGKMIPTALAHKIMEFKAKDLPYQPLIKFAENLLENPSTHSIEQLFGFLEKNDHPITNDGYFIAYKKIGSDWKDIHSKTMDNSPGMKVSMPREEVDDDPDRTCSRGLHVANWEYPTKHFGNGYDRLIEVKVNPRDVVAVPNDYNNSKMRVCEYIVLAEIETPREEALMNYDSAKSESRGSTPDHCEDDEDSDELAYESEDEDEDVDSI